MTLPVCSTPDLLFPSRRHTSLSVLCVFSCACEDPVPLSPAVEEAEATAPPTPVRQRLPQSWRLTDEEKDRMTLRLPRLVSDEDQPVKRNRARWKRRSDRSLPVSAGFLIPQLDNQAGAATITRDWSVNMERLLILCAPSSGQLLYASPALVTLLSSRANSRLMKRRAAALSSSPWAAC